MSQRQVCIDHDPPPSELAIMPSVHSIAATWLVTGLSKLMLMGDPPQHGTSTAALD